MTRHILKNSAAKEQNSTKRTARATGSPNARTSSGMNLNERPASGNWLKDTTVTEAIAPHAHATASSNARNELRCLTCTLTNSVYPPRREVWQVARRQTRRINLVGLNRRPECGRVGGIGDCKVGAQVHAQIMTVDLARGLIVAPEFASITLPFGCVTRLRKWQAHRRCRRAQPCPWLARSGLQTGADGWRCVWVSWWPPADGHQRAAWRWQPRHAHQNRCDV